MPRSAPVDGFRLAYERHGGGTPVVLLHGWPGSREDYADVRARLADAGADVLVPDLRGFGESDRHADARPAAFAASIGWYRAGAGTVALASAERPPRRADRLATPTTVLWPDSDPLFPLAWADRLDDHFERAELRVLRDVGHFVPLEAPDAVAGAIRERL